MSELKATVVTLIYNDVSSLLVSVESLINQDYRNVEYLIVDDSSAQVSSVVLNEVFLKLDLNSVDYKYIKNGTNIGTVKSFNKAILNSSGDVIIPLSPGDVFVRDTSIGMIMSRFSSGCVDLLTYKSLEYLSQPYDLGRKFKQKYWHRRMLNKSPHEILKYILSYGNIISGAATSYRKDFLIDCGLFDERYRLLEDYPFYIKVLSFCNYSYLDEPIIHYQLGGVSTSGSSFLLREDYAVLRSYVESCAQIEKFLRKRFLVFYLFSSNSKIKTLCLYPAATVRMIFNKLMVML